MTLIVMIILVVAIIAIVLTISTITWRNKLKIPTHKKQNEEEQCTFDSLHTKQDKEDKKFLK